jgi:hypothetical protein
MRPNFRLALIPLALAAMSALGLEAQHGRRAGGSADSAARAPSPLRGVIISVHGKVKDLNKKAIVVLDDDNKLMSLRHTSKTKFYRDGKQIKSFEIDLESVVTVDVSEDNDLKFLAIAVKAEPKEKKILTERDLKNSNRMR